MATTPTNTGQATVTMPLVQMPPSLPPFLNITHNPARPELEILVKGFEVLALAGTFFAAIQAQIASTMAPDRDTAAACAINVFFLGGLILDIISASLAFLTARWLQRLSEEEKDELELEFGVKNGRLPPPPLKSRRPPPKGFLYAWLSSSLFVPMPLLVSGVACMISGIYVYVWSQQPKIVAGLVTLIGVATLPFIAGVFLIGRETERRKAIIHCLSTRQGDW